MSRYQLLRQSFLNNWREFYELLPLLRQAFLLNWHVFFLWSAAAVFVAAALENYFIQLNAGDPSACALFLTAILMSAVQYYLLPKHEQHVLHDKVLAPVYAFFSAAFFASACVSVVEATAAWHLELTCFFFGAFQCIVACAVWINDIDEMRRHLEKPAG